MYRKLEEVRGIEARVSFLELKNQNLEEVQGLFKLARELRGLKIGWCEADKLPDSLRDCVGLVELIVLNTPLRVFPGWLPNLVRLRRLTLRGTELAEMPG